MESEVVLTHQPCPDCGSSDALTVYTDHTFCFSCETHHNGTGDTPKEHPKALKGTIHPQDMTFEALSKRGITQTTCRKYGYYVTTYNGDPCQVACYCDDSGNIIGQKLRFADKHFSVLGNLSHRFFGQHLWAQGKRLVITEGEIDCLTVSQVGGNKYPVVSIPNGCQSAKRVFKEQLEWLNNFEEIIVMFDMDEPGRKATDDVCRILPPGKLKLAYLPLKDPNECLIAGRPDAILDAIFQAKTYKPDGIINGTELWEILKDEPDEDQGYPFPWNIPLQEMTLGIRKGELIVITAGSGTGKTTFVRQIAHHFGVGLKLKVGMMMLEENIKRTAKGLMAVQSGKRLALNRHLVSDEEYQKIYNETLGNGNFVFYQHFGSLESDNLMSKIRYLAVAEKCDFIILDHITIAISGLDIENERKATDVLMTNLRSLVEETGVGLLIISHLKRVDGQPAEEGGAISLSHLRGSHALAQLSDGVWALERNQQAEDLEEKNLVKVRVLKNRHSGETGLAGYLKYDKETDRLEATTKKRESKADYFKEDTESDF
ncbi:DnaB-like helicase C-terminal domain-containing protein [Phascolarctobacterium faecium]|jgi:twinkle protein